MLKIYYSNKLSIHKNFISSIIQNDPIVNPLEKEIIIVQNLNIIQWIKVELSKNLGIIANIYFPSLNRFILDISNCFIPNFSVKNILNEKTIAWKLMEIIPSLFYKSEFRLLKKYFQKDQDKKKLYQFSISLSKLYNKYLIYHPEWIKSWENQNHIIEIKNCNQEWQKILWIHLKQTLNEFKWNKINFYQQLINKFNTKKIKIPNKIPKRIFIFNITTFPLLYLQIFNSLSNHIDVNIMIVNPHNYDYITHNLKNTFSEEIKKNKKYYFEEKKNNLKTKKLKFNLLKNKNFLIDFFKKSKQNELYFLNLFKTYKKITFFKKPSGDFLLNFLQKDIFDLQNNFALKKKVINKNFYLKKEIDKKDTSITFHLCQNKRREIEVLHDHLLSLFKHNPKLAPKDIIVMAPNINDYADYIEVIFNKKLTKNCTIPFFILEKNITQIYPILQKFLNFLELFKTKFEPEKVLNILEISELSKKFLFKKSDLCLLRILIKNSEICWGLDEIDKKYLKIPQTNKNTWIFGLKRMLLGYVMNSNNRLWNKISAYGEYSNKSIELIEKLSIFIQSLIFWRNILKKEKKIIDWMSICQPLLNSFFEFDQEISEKRITILKGWKNIFNAGIKSEYKNKISFDLILDQFKMYCNSTKIFHLNYSSINFCSLLFAYTNISFKVVCLLGINKDKFPKIHKNLEFDLMNEKFNYNYKYKKNDDYYLFLKIFSSTKKNLYISYSKYSFEGQKKYPSVIINKFLEYIAQKFFFKKHKNLSFNKNLEKIKKYLVIKHTSAPFLIENYLKHNIYQSYSNQWLQAIQKVNEKHDSPTQIIFQKKNHFFKEILLEQLLSFYKNPIKTFFQNQLKINFFNRKVELPKEEPFLLNQHKKYKLNKYLLDNILQKKSLKDTIKNLYASGSLPIGNFAKICLRKQIEEMKPLINKLKIKYKELNHHQLINIKIKNTHLLGNLKNIQKDGVIRYRPGNLTIEDGMSLWIEHLFFSLIVSRGKSYFFGKNNTKWKFESISKKEAQINILQLIEGFNEGMSEPFPLLLKSGWNWILSLYDRKNNQFNFLSNKLLKIAEIKLFNTLYGISNFQKGEVNNIYIKKAFPSINETLIKKIKEKAKIYLLPMAILTKNKEFL